MVKGIRFFGILFLLVLLSCCSPKDLNMEIPNRFTRLPQDLEKKATDLDSLFTELYHTGRFNGNVLAAEKGRVFFHRSFGYADMEQEIPLTPNSIFDIGSISKQFTAAAIMLLEQERALNYDDYACTYLPEIPYKDITIRHLLTHTSGLPDYVDFSNVEYDPEKQFTNRYIIDLLLQQNPILNFTPGDNWSYSNLGYLLLAQIVQNISGKSLHDYLKLNLFEPAGMNYTAHKDNINESMESFRTKGYIFYLPTQGPEVAVELPDPEINYPARNATAGPAWINSCTIDLYLWDRMLYTEKILTNANLEQAFAQIILNNGEAYDYGFGWFCYRDNDNNEITMHGGGIPGYGAKFIRNITRDRTLIILTNYYAEPSSYLEEITHSAWDIVSGREYSLPKFSLGIEIFKLLNETDDNIMKKATFFASDTLKYDYSARSINRMGNLLNYYGGFDLAARIFHFSKILFPGSSEAYTGAGIACFNLGNRKKAKENFIEALNINSKNILAREWLEKLNN